jgi:hypothetical protein
MEGALMLLAPNQTAIDRFTLIHGGVGYAVGRLGIDWRAAIAGAVAFEAIEDGLKSTFPDVFPHAEPDSKLNALVDVGAFLAGYALSLTREGS